MRMENGILRHLLRAIPAALFMFVGLSPAHAVKVMLEGTHYQILWGQAESNYLVLPYPPEWTPGPYCFKMDTSIQIRIVPEPGENITTWKVTGASLYSVPFDIEYWGVPESNCMTVAQTYTLPPLPPFIDAVSLVGDVVMDNEVEPPGGGALVGSFGRSSDIYVVMDTPRVPMAPAWAPVLNNSCFWAAGEYTTTGANQVLTNSLYAAGTYNGGNPAYVRNITESGETFHLKSFFGHLLFPWGECEDFADFLVCLSTSVGASPTMKAQRTNPLPNPLPHPPEEDYQFIYRWLTPAGGGSPISSSFEYHQFGLVTSNVWDGCILILGFGVPKGWARDSTYKNQLVERYVVGNWSPTPSAGFTPALTTSPP